MKKLNCGEPKPAQMTLTLDDCFINDPYGVLEEVLVRVDGLLFLADFLILDMLEYSKTPLILKRLFLATDKALIDVELGELALRFNKIKVIFNVFEAIKK